MAGRIYENCAHPSLAPAWLRFLAIPSDGTSPLHLPSLWVGHSFANLAPCSVLCPVLAMTLQLLGLQCVPVSF